MSNILLCFFNHIHVKQVDAISPCVCSVIDHKWRPGTPVHPSVQKPTFPNSNSILEWTDISERVLVNSLVLRG